MSADVKTFDYWMRGEPFGAAAKSDTVGMDYFARSEPFGAGIIAASGGTPSFSVDLTTIPANHSGSLTLSLTGANTIWSSGSTVTITNSVTGTTTVTKGTWTRTSNTAATLTVTTAAGTGTYTITIDGTVSPSLTVAAASFTLSITSGPISTNQSETATGTNTLWTHETAATLFTVSGGTGSSISSIVVTSDTSATFTLTPGSAAGTLTITDAPTGDTASFAVVANSIVLTNPVQYQTFQRTGQTFGQGGTGSIAITGTYTGFPTHIEASWNGGAYQTITASPAGGVYSGTLTGQPAGQGTLTVRFTNDTTANVTRTLIGIGDVFGIYGQSNASGRGTNNQVYTHPTLKAALYKNNNTWTELLDPTDDATGQTSTGVDTGVPMGSIWPLVATSIMAYTGVPVAFIPAAYGGQSITNLYPYAGTNTSTPWGVLRYRCLSNATPSSGAIGYGGGNPLAILFWEGETDASAAMAQATYYGYYTQLSAAVASDLGSKVMPCKLQNCSDAGITAGRAGVDAAVAQAWSSDANSYAGPDLSGIPTAPEDTAHLKTDAKLASAAGLFWNSIKTNIYGVAPAGALIRRIITGGE